MTETPLSDAGDSAPFESYFREPALAAEQPLVWALNQRLAVLDALRGLFTGPQALVRLRLWCFMELVAQPRARLVRDDLNQLFHMLWPEALDTVLKRLRELGLLVWDATAQDYHLSPMAQQVHGLLAGLTTAPTDDDDMGALLAQVAGAQALGLSDANQLRHLHAQLARLYDEFAEAIASGSETRLRLAQPRFDRALALVDRAGQALSALIRADHDDPRLEREARALGQEQARLLSMASQFTRALQQADRQRVTLGSSGLTTSDVRHWLQGHPALHELLGQALSIGVRPVFVSQHDLIDVAEGEFERDRPDPLRSAGLPPPSAAAEGSLETLSMPAELGALIGLLGRWADDAEAAPEAHPADPVADPQRRPRAVDGAVLGGRFAQAAYRLQLLPLLGDAQAQTLQGQTGDLARTPWRLALSPTVREVDDPQVSRLSDGHLEPLAPAERLLSSEPSARP